VWQDVIESQQFRFCLTIHFANFVAAFA